ncbi:host cell division inhibitor Icd-like protein [Escherichia coli O170:H18]|nr:host cell division inhibitor Icd-like protein [Escherichia coli O170:H18]
MGYISATWKGREENTLFIQKCENNFIWRFIALSTAQPRVITIVATSEQEARQKNQLIAIASQGYDLSAPAKSGAGIGVLEITRAHNTRLACFFVPHSHTLSMVGCTGAEKSAPGSLVSGYANPVQSTTSEIGVSCGGYYQSTREAANMATIPTLVHSQTAFLWRFVIFGASDHQIIHVTAWTEREARNRCPSGCVAVFAARIRQEVCHA